MAQTPKIPYPSLAPTAGNITGSIHGDDFREAPRQDKTRLAVAEYYKLMKDQQDEANAWSAAQAERAMQYQTDMSNTAHQREVADLKAAGLNPLLSAGTSGATTGSGVAAVPGTQHISGLMGLASKALSASIEQSKNMAATAKSISQPVSMKEIERLFKGISAKSGSDSGSKSDSDSKPDSGSDSGSKPDSDSGSGSGDRAKIPRTPTGAAENGRLSENAFIDIIEDWLYRHLGIKQDSVDEVLDNIQDFIDEHRQEIDRYIDQGKKGAKSVIQGQENRIKAVIDAYLKPDYSVSAREFLEADRDKNGHLSQQEMARFQHEHGHLPGRGDSSGSKFVDQPDNFSGRKGKF